MRYAINPQTQFPPELSEDLKECAEIISLTDRRMERIRKQAEEL